MIPKKFVRTRGIQELSQYVNNTEAGFLLYGDRYDPTVTPWMPYQPAEFVSILWECTMHLEGAKFIDIGCGPGTKMKIARDLFGLQVSGIEIDGGMAMIAALVGEVCVGDALEVPARTYDKCDLIWLYRPFRDTAKELALEQRVIEHMKPGAILAGSSWEIDPGELGWEPVVDDCLLNPTGGEGKIVRGAWLKPSTPPCKSS